MSQLPILRRAFTSRLIFFLFFLLSIFFLNTGDTSARTRCGVAEGSCGPAVCSSGTQSSVWEGSVLYSDQDNCAVQPYTIVVEYFSDSACTQSTSNPCPASCTSSSECNGGVCANTSLTAEDICRGVEPSGNKWCMGALCGYGRGSCNGTTYDCFQLLPPDGIGYPDLASCQASCSLPPTPTPTPLPAPNLSGSCSADGATINYSWNSITNADHYAIRIDDTTANGWNSNTALTGDTIDNNVAGTSYPRSSVPGHNYDAWVHAVDNRGVYSASSDHSKFTCSAPATTAAPTAIPTTAPQYTCTASDGTRGYCGTSGRNFDPFAIPPCSGTDLVVSDGTCPAGSIYSTCYVCTAAPTDCVSCGTGGICTGAPPQGANALSSSCPACPGDSWEYLGDDISFSVCQANPSTQYPWCHRCTTAPAPTAPPVPSGVPTPTPTPAGCAARFSGNCRSGTSSDIGSCEFGACSTQKRTCRGTCTEGSMGGSTLTSQSMVNECTAGGGNVTSVFWGSLSGSCPVAPTATPTSTVPGIVFIDRNANGRKDTDEIGYSGGDSGGARLFLNTQTATTDATGAYQFTSVTSGSYTLELDVPFGFSPNKSTGYSAATGTNKLTFTIPPAVTSADFGIVPYEVGVGGTMYTTLDSNCSTSITSQGRLGSKALSLLENYFGQTFNASTDINGAYSFSAPNQTLFPSSYSLTPSDVTGARLVCAVVDAGSVNATAVTVRSTPYAYGPFDLTAQNPQKRVDFYYQLVQPWFQGKGADMRIDSGFKDPVSASSRDPYAMLSNDRSPGVIFSGGNSYSFCTGGAGTCLNRASELANPWVVGGTIYPETFTSAITGTARTSYGYLLGLVGQNGQAINEITNSDCYSESRGCDLAALDPGVYTNQTGQTDVYTRSSKSQFNRGDYVFLINGNLHIQGELELVNTPNDAVLVVSVSGDITVDKGVGGSPSSSSTHLEGLFSADSDFILESEGASGDNCPSNRDKRLNVEGAIIANAGLGGGTFQNNRTLCDDNSDNPIFYIEESPYLILNAPDFLKHQSFVWQEVAP